MKMRSAILAAILAASVAVTLSAQVKERPIPRLVKKDGRYALFVDDAPYLMLGAQAHNSSGWPAMLPKVWPAMEYLNVNTLEIPVYWEQFEPQQGNYDHSVIDALLFGARQHHLRLVLLWFGTWKNGSQHYMPEWMKLDPVRYPHLTDKNGKPADSPSPFAAASLEADKTAFAAFMRYLKSADPQRTVIMVQVENEPGAWGSTRDYSPAAQKLFESPAPADVLAAMKVGPAANWHDAFGPEAEVCFHAWAVAKYVGQVAAAGKAVYPLPLYANAALRDPLKPGAPGSYESGGPTDNVIPIWKVAAPALDVLAPDIYQNDPVAYLKVLELYHRDDNALFVPETGGVANNARFFFSALGLQAIGYSPFGMDYTTARNTPESLAPWAANYRLIAPMQREIARLNFEGKLQAVAEEKGKVTQTLAFGSWNAIVSYGATRNNRAAGNAEPIGRMLVGQLKDNQFLLAGLHGRVDFRPADPEKHRQFLRVEEGAYENGVFKFLRIWNGDETDWGLNFGAEPLVLRVSVAMY
jgi:beta-galactosidase GanA